MPSASARPLRAVLAFAGLTLGGLASMAPRAAHAQRCTPGAALDVEWNGTYYPATVKRAPDAQGRCFIGYDGYGANWDEWVTPARLRARGAAAAAVQGAAPAGRAPAAPVGAPAPAAPAPAAPAPAGMEQRAGAPFAAREPHACPNVQATANRPPSPATAAAVVICKAEGVNGFNSLFLVTNVRVQVGNGTPYRELPFAGRPTGGVDPTATVYSIRGSYTQYICSPISAWTKAGENCTRLDYPRAEGNCFRDNFGEWQCGFTSGEALPRNGTPNQPPPRN